MRYISILYLDLLLIRANFVFNDLWEIQKNDRSTCGPKISLVSLSDVKNVGSLVIVVARIVIMILPVSGEWNR